MMDTLTERQITLDDMRDHFAEYLGQLGDTPLTITAGGEPVGVVLSPQAYTRMHRVQAYLQMVKISANLRASGVTVDDLTRAARADLETREWS